MANFTYSGAVAVKGTTFLKASDIDLSTSVDYDLEPSDAAQAKTIQKEFQSLMEKAAKNQVDALNKWLAEKDQAIAKMVKRHDELKTMFPVTAQEAALYASRVKEVETIAGELKELPGVFRKMVENWAEGFIGQQRLIAIQSAVKSARIKTFNAKSFRVKAGLAIKVTLVVAATALAIAAIVLTAGAAAPVFVALAAAGIALSGIAGLGGAAKSLAANVDTEKKLLANVMKDVEAVQAAFGGVSKSGSALSKHVTELQNLTKIREDQIRGLEMELKRYRVSAAGYTKQIAELGSAAVVDKGKLKNREKLGADTSDKLDRTLARITTLKADNQKATAILKDLTDLGLQLDKISGQSPNSLLGNLKARFTSVDGWLDLSGQLGGLASGISGAHS